MPPVPASVVRQAEKLRISGNEYYRKGRIGAAIDAYTESIVLFPEVVACWTNRAQCFKKKGQWRRVEEDCRSAISLDTKSVKGHYLLGLALLERQEYDNGIKELETAFDLARGANPLIQLVEEIWQVLAKAKFTSWEMELNKRSWKLRILKEACEEALRIYYTDAGSRSEGIPDMNRMTLKEHLQLPEDSMKSLKEHLQLLSQVFNIASAADKPSEVPDYLCCKITLDIFRDPVISPAGVTYERAVILDHLHKVGRFDPVTREPLEEHQLVPNLALREAVQAFLDQHGWAYSTVDAPIAILSEE